MKILGIDPGLQKTGWGIIHTEGNTLRYVASGLIKTSAADPLPQRLSHLHTELSNVVMQFSSLHPPASGEEGTAQADSGEALYAAVEETFVNKNPASALKLGQARGVVLAVPAILGIPTAEYSANKIKKSVVGTGHAAKQQIALMIRTLLPSCGQISEDEADALAVAVTHAHHGRAVISQYSSHSGCERRLSPVQRAPSAQRLSGR